MKVNTEKVTAAGVPVQLGDRMKYDETDEVLYSKHAEH